jgi:hypothetical protein
MFGCEQPARSGTPDLVNTNGSPDELNERGNDNRPTDRHERVNDDGRHAHRHIKLWVRRRSLKQVQCAS